MPARALVKSSDLLLLDEPCQNLDLFHRNMFMQAIDSLLRNTDITIVYVTNTSEEIPNVILKTIDLREGRVYRAK